MIILNLQQRSSDWIAARLWRLTASNFKKSGVITATGELSKSQTAMAHIHKMYAGLEAANSLDFVAALSEKDDRELQKWIANFTGDAFFGNAHTERGNDLEADAIAALSSRIGEQVEDVGMCIMGTHPMGVVSCSPDGLIYRDGIAVAGAEVKCPTLATYYGYVMEGGLPAEYALQVHGSMAVCELDVWHFAAYFYNQPLFYVRVVRDKFTEKIAKTLENFQHLYASQTAELASKIATLKIIAGGDAL